MVTEGLLLITRAEVASLLDTAGCIEAVEEAFLRRHSAPARGCG